MTRLLADTRPVSISDWVIPATVGSAAGTIKSIGLCVAVAALTFMIGRSSKGCR